jgi:phage shock protein B
MHAPHMMDAMPGIFDFLIHLVSIGAMIVALVVVAATFIMGLRMLTRSGRGHREERKHESRTVQEVHRGLTELERRLENLETLIIERERREGRGSSTGDK